MSRQTYVNPICGGQDPYFMRGVDGLYYSVFGGGERGNGLFVTRSRRLSEQGAAHLVFTLPARGWNSGAVWAPELHYLGGKYYIYYTSAAADGHIACWQTRKLGVLEADQPLGPYRDKGMLRLDDAMSIDGTVVESRGKLYFVYMRADRFGDCLNKLYIAPMASPTEIAGAPCFLSQPEYPWEEYVNEGPEAIRHDGKLMLLYSAHAMHTGHYCLALLECLNEDDITNAASWRKIDHPVFQSGNGVLAPGHASVTVAPDGRTPVLVYHQKALPTEDFWIPDSKFRTVCVQPFSWRDDGTPDFGEPLPLGRPQPLLPGEEEDAPGRLIDDAIRDGSDDLISCGAREGLNIADNILYLPGYERPETGCKAFLRGYTWTDARAEVDLRMPDGEGAGLLLRCTNAGAVCDMLEGYVVRLCPRFGMQAVEVGKRGVVRLGHCALPYRAGEWVRLRAEIIGDRMTFRVGEYTMTVRSQTYARGRIGLAADRCMGWFKNLRVEAIANEAHRR